MLRVVVIFAFALTGVTSAQTYPNKPVRLVTSAAGGGGDIAAREIAQGIAAALGQQLIVENRPGALPGEIVSKAPPDGYTLLVHGGAFWNAPLFRKTPYDPIRDFAPITWVATSPNVLIVHPSLPVKSVKDLVTLAKRQPGALNYSSGPSGGSSHLAAELFKALAHVDIVRVGYSSGAQEIIDLISGQVQVNFNGSATVTPLIRARKVRGIAVGTPKPSALFPDLPTVAATVPGFVHTANTGIFAPAKTPEPVILRLNQEVVRFLKSAGVSERFLERGVELVGSSPDELGATVKSEIARLGDLIRSAGIKLE